MAGDDVAVIYDVGNVLIRWDPRNLYRDLLSSDNEIEAFLQEVDLPGFNLALDAGLDWDEGVAALCGRHPHRAELIRAFQDRWHDTVPGTVEGSPEILASLGAAGVPLYAITNFSVPRWRETCARFPFLANSFRDVVVSGEERIVKPDPAIFRRCLDRNGLVAERCIFIDDSPANVAGAAALGIDAILFTDAPALASALAKRGLPV